MHFEHEGMSLWYGTPDAPAPRETVQADTDITITVGVQPMNAGNNVEVLYRINQGPTEKVTAKWLRNDTYKKSQYFRASLPAFRAGDMVEYAALCRRAGRWVVPAPEEVEHFASSFRVKDSMVGPEPSLARNDGAMRTQAMATISPRESVSSRSLASPLLQPGPGLGQPTRKSSRSEAHIQTDLGVPVPPPKPSTFSLSELAKTLRLGLPRQLLPTLEKHGINTLADIREAGGIRHIEGLSVAANDPALRTLEAYAKLSVLSTDVALNSILIDKGFTSVGAIAHTPQSLFINTLRAQLGDFKAAQLHLQARAQRDFLSNVLTQIRADGANGFANPLVDQVADLEGIDSCECSDCRAAVSPAAYLLDLLDFAIQKLTSSNGPIDLSWLTANLHQPFADLVVSCGAVESLVHQVRICSEVLRNYVATGAPQPGESEYRLVAYQSLLSKVGTSYEEIRLARSDPAEKRQALAERLGIELDTPQPDHLDTLLLDPKTLSEEQLEELFGLADTTRPPLSDGAKRNDPGNHITRWNLAGVACGQNTDAEGVIYASLTSTIQVGGTDPTPPPDGVIILRVSLFRDSLGTQLVAFGQQPTFTGVGSVLLTEKNNSGLSGQIDVNFGGSQANTSRAAGLPAGAAGDGSLIELQAVPRFLSWRLKHLRTLWEAQDRPPLPKTAPPIIDPDLIGQLDFKNPNPMDPAYQLWQNRSSQLSQQLNAWSSQVGNQPGNIDPLIASVLGTSITELLALRDQRMQGKDITARLNQLNIALDAFLRLLRLRDLALSNVQLLDEEWAEFYSILLQTWKRQQFASWQSEEEVQHILLSPDFFVIPAPTPLPSTPQPTFVLIKWRATQQARNDWQDTLQARIDQQQAIQGGLATAVDICEEETLPMLRDALLMAVDPTEQDLQSKARWFTTNLLIDAQVAGCQKTTRIAQAIETVQGAIFAARSGQTGILGFNNADPIFDEEWQWIGSYAAWRAAMFIFLYPENVLIPTLRKPEQQTPAFRNLIDTLLPNRRLTPEQACEAASTYSQYFRDVCNLTIEASCTAITHVQSGDCRHKAQTQGDRMLFYVFGRGVSNTVYWSTYDAQAQPGGSQTFWDTIPGLDSAIQIIGAVPYLPDDRQHLILLFARTQDQSVQKLVFTTYDLQEQRWSGKLIELSLPQNESTFTATVQQRDNVNHPPLVVICIKGAQGTKDGDQDLSGQTLLYLRRLNRAATDWEASNFLRLNLIAEHVGDPDPTPTQALALLTEVFPIAPITTPPQPAGEREGGNLFVGSQDGFFAIKWIQYGMFDLQGEEMYGHSNVVTMNFIAERYAQKSFIGAFMHPDPSLQSNLFLYVRDTQSGSVAVWIRGIDLPNYDFTFDWAETDRLQRIAAHCGYDPSLAGRQVVRQDLTPDYYRGPRLSQSTIATFIKDQNDNQLWFWGTMIAPLDSGPYKISEQFTESDLQGRALDIQWAYTLTSSSGKYLLSLESNRVYLDEAYYFVPVSLALQLQEVGQYIAALDWFRTVYDYAAPDGQRFIWDGFRQEQGPFPVLQRPSDWLLDPLNPHQIAANRAGTYLRFTLLALVRCFLDYADAEFTRDTAESIPRARRLYMTAQELLNLKELNLQFGQCSTIIGELDIPLGGEWTGAAWRLKQALAGISDKATLKAVVAQLQEVFQGSGSLEARFERAGQLVRQAQERASSPLTISCVLEQRSRTMEKAERALIARPEISAALQGIGDVVGRDFQLRVAAFSGTSSERLLKEHVTLPWLTSPTEITTARANENPGSPWQLLVDRVKAPAHLTSATSVDTMPNTDRAKSIARIAMGRVQPFGGVGGGGFVPGSAIGFCIPQNPLLVALHLRAELNLFKLRNCRNIAGDVRSLEPYTAPTDTSSGLPEIGTGQTLILPGVATLAPTPYRYTVLIERAKQLATSAQQIEAAMLLALEKRDSEYYTLLKARQDVSLTQATVRLQDLIVAEAQSSVTVAELQQERAQTQADHFKKLLDEGISDLELASMNLLKTAADVQIAAAVINFFAATLPSSQLTWSPQGSATAIAGGLSSIAGSLSTQASVLSTLASYERRTQDWQFQQSLAQQDIKIGAQQVKVAQDHVRVAGQQHKIAELQAEHAQAVVEFLGNKFTSYELYDWMSGVLEGVYSYFLQQATATAQLALNQLAFERQQTPPPFIRADYWQPPSENGQSPDGKAPDRRGLTGSARLLQDITQLDQYRFDTDQRKLQLVKTISIAGLATEAFVRFQETGVLTFETPMELFDRDFPGHYLRLIKRVRVSIVALIPPTTGIRATLTSDRISRVVIGGDIFQTVRVQHGPDYVALSSPREATGLFELDVQSDMLLPFEGIGVATNWVLRMPKAANLFDYRTIADVLFTIEYTALNSFTYGQQVMQMLRPDLSAQRPFSFSNQFADAWYDLHNPDQVAPPAVPMTVQFTTIREDFPPNLDDLKIQHVALYFVRKADNLFEVVNVRLHFTPKGDIVAVGGSADSIDGIISTRNGNGSSWTSMIGLSPVGEWELALPDTKDDGGQTRDHFKNEEIEDMLFVITYSGRTPAWPT